MKKFIKKLKQNILPIALAIAIIFGVVGGGVWLVYKEMADETAVKPLAGGSTIAQFAANLTSPETYNQPLLIKLSDLLISILPLGANPARAQVKDNIVKYIDAYANTDIVQTRYYNKIKEDIILKQPGHPEVFKYQIDISQFDISRDAGGNLFFYDKGHKGIGSYLRFTIPAPFMVDATGKKSATKDVETSLDKSGLLTVKPNAKWLAQAQYPVTLDPTVEITILNVHSHPQQGENWTIDFTTQGTADLKIIPNDQATIDDDEFYSLTCGGETKTPQIFANGVVSYPSWQCDGQSQVVFYTKKAGNHVMRFEFGDQTSYAYNNAPVFYATGGTVTYSGGYEIHTFTAVGTDTFKVYGSGSVEYLVVAGGGGGGGGSGSTPSGGGGAGGYKSGTLSVASGGKTVTVGGGGAGGINNSTKGSNGGDSTFDSITSTGGGGGGANGSSYFSGLNGGSGGGASYTGTPGTGTVGQGNDGGSGNTGTNQGSGGGGGASTVGANGEATAGGNGGTGAHSSISGTDTGYAGGGGGSVYNGGTPGTSEDGGGAGKYEAADIGGSGYPGTANTGGGGGGIGGNGGVNSKTGGAGGSGIVIVRLIPVWPAAPVFYAVGGTVTRAGGYEIHTFTNTGTSSITFIGSGTVNYLVVGGGGGGAGFNGGGGAGGLLAGTLSVTAGSKTVTVGGGGSPGDDCHGGSVGSNSVFDSLTAIGGGGGGGYVLDAPTGGGSGGGAADDSTVQAGGAGTAGPPRQGYNGGSNAAPVDSPYTGAGGGGAGEAGGTPKGEGGTSKGGDGLSSAISGTPTDYAGGGGGGGQVGQPDSPGLGGLGGGGDGSCTGAGVAGTANTGGGGGGGAYTGPGFAANPGGAGGSGIVIISFMPTLPPPIIFRSTGAGLFNFPANFDINFPFGFAGQPMIFRRGVIFK